MQPPMQLLPPSMDLGCLITTSFLLSLISILLIRATFSKTRRRKSRLPPSPPSLPIIGHLHLIRPPLHQSFHNLTQRYGPLIRLRLGSSSCIVASSPDTVKELLKFNDFAVANRYKSSAVRRFAYDSSGFAFAPYGPSWKFMKKLCMSELLNGRMVDQLSPVRRHERITLLQTLLDKSASQKAVDVSSELITMANRVITRMVTSSTSPSGGGGDADEARELVKQVAELVGVFNLADFFSVCRIIDLQGFNKRIEQVHERFDALIERLIREKVEARRRRRERGERDDGMKDLMDTMLDISEDENAEMKLTKENIKGFVVDVFTGGSDSSAATIEWALAELINHPRMLEKTREEIDRAVGKSRLVEESDIPNLPYLQAVVKETLRLHPAVPLAIRESTEDIKVGDYEIPANTGIFVNVWSVGRDPNHWEAPLEFRPDRFTNKEKLDDGHRPIDFKGQHFHFLPFGSGRRMCPGISLSLQVVQVTLASLVQCFEWKVGVLDMGEGLGMVIPRAEPLVCVPEARLDLFPLLHL